MSIASQSLLHGCSQAYCTSSGLPTTVLAHMLADREQSAYMQIIAEVQLELQNVAERQTVAAIASRLQSWQQCVQVIQSILL